MPFSLPSSLETSRLILRETSAADAQAIFAGYMSDPEAMRFLSIRPHQSVTDTIAFLTERDVARRAGHSDTYAILHRATAEVIGLFDLRIEKPYRLTCGFGLARPYWGKDLTTEALAAIIRWVASQPDIQRLWADCDVENYASARVMEKAGMTREGILRSWNRPPNLPGGGPRDCIAYAWVRPIG